MRISRPIIPLLFSLGLVLILLRALEGQHTHAVGAHDGLCRARVDDETADYATVQAAVDAAQGGALVKVAGYCAGVEERAGGAQTVYISKSITLRGGYTAEDWTTPNRTAHPTVLDADERGRVITIVGPPPDAGEKLSVTLEGLAKTGGDADGLGGGRYPWEDVGGGIRGCNAAIAIRDTRIFENKAQRGGGLYLYRGELEFERNSVFHNGVRWTGGGLHLDEMSYASLAESAFFSNTASWDGGGLYVRGCTATLRANRFTTNVAHRNGAGLYLRFSNAVLEGNDVVRGRADLHGGGAYLDRNDVITLTDNVVVRNQVGVDGAGMYLDESRAWFNRNRIIANAAGGNGGGLYVLGTDAAQVINAIISDNKGRQGSGVYIDRSSADLVHTTIASNAAGSGVYVGEASAATLTNTILVSHTTGISVADSGRAVLEATLWSSDLSAKGGLCDGEGTIVTGTRNYWGNADFVNPDARDYHIGSGSAAIGKGMSIGVLHDMDGDPRSTVSATDLGADETYQIHLPLVLKQHRPGTAQSRRPTGLSSDIREGPSFRWET